MSRELKALLETIPAMILGAIRGRITGKISRKILEGIHLRHY